MQAEHLKACAVVGGSILEAVGADFHRIDLNAVSRHWTAIASWVLRWSAEGQGGLLVRMKNLPDCGSGQAKLMMA